MKAPRSASVLLALALLAPAILALPACAGAQGRPSGGGSGRAGGDAYANVGAVVAAELAFARTAQEKGQWTAFAQTSTDRAVMFVPEAVNAHQWLKKRANPAEAVRWQPHEVFSSCDGSLAVTRGSWQRPDGTSGYFTTAWARQKDGTYRWVMDQGDTLAQPLAAPEMIGSKVAECRERGPRGEGRDGDRRDGGRGRAFRPATLTGPTCDANGCRGAGEAADGSLRFDYTVKPDGARSVTVSLKEDGALTPVVTSEVAAAAG